MSLKGVVVLVKVGSSKNLHQVTFFKISQSLHLRKMEIRKFSLIILRYDFTSKLNRLKLPGWDGMMGLQFENLIYKSEKLIFRELGVKLNEVIFANPYYQTQTKTRKCCQIEYLIQTKFNNVYVGEIKFSKIKVGVSVVEEVQEKISRLKLPRNFSYRPVLIHANRVTEDLIDLQYFSNIIDFSKFLEKK